MILKQANITKIFLIKTKLFFILIDCIVLIQKSIFPSYLGINKLFF